MTVVTIDPSFHKIFAIMFMYLNKIMLWLETSPLDYLSKQSKQVPLRLFLAVCLTDVGKQFVYHNVVKI